MILFKAVLQAGEVSLAVIAIAMAVLSVYLYMKVVITLYMRPGKAVGHAPAMGSYERMGGVLILLFLLWAGVAPSPLLPLIARIVPSGG